ncbi:MAG TPA: helix-hairpin-helix domain-containing protein [Gammaproteobacteria bacterium]|nr:helix-hairpin-helix domain-containing protein [Gammaproteobacteria bacterium]
MKGLTRILGILTLTLSAAAAFAAGKVNINTADAKALAAALDGVGQSRAEAIVQYRNEHGPFKTVEALANVKGIGQSVLKANLDRMTVSAEKQAEK